MSIENVRFTLKIVHVGKTGLNDFKLIAHDLFRCKLCWFFSLNHCSGGTPLRLWHLSPVYPPRLAALPGLPAMHIAALGGAPRVTRRAKWRQISQLLDAITLYV